MFVKICGITSESDALFAVAMGADAVGFIFAPSKRQIAPSIARDIARRLPAEILTVGVFRNQMPERVVEVVNGAGLKAAQLHGNETEDDTRYVGSRVPVVIKAFGSDDVALYRADDYGADAVLLDAPEPGSGKTFDWSIVDNLNTRTRVILAGGLGPNNVRDAIERVRPWGVDVASGVEAERGEPGAKDPHRVMAFVKAAKSAGADFLDDGVEIDHGPYDWHESGWL